MKKKKIAKLIGVTLLTGAVGAGVIVGASYLGDYFVFLDDTYLPREKIEYLTDELGLDDSITYKQDFNRLRHKNGEPINISFDENYPEECKTYSIEAIDNLFNLVHEINPLYTYSIVDDTHAADLEFRNSTIPIDNATGIANYFDHSVTIDLSSSFFYNEDGTIRPH